MRRPALQVDLVSKVIVSRGTRLRVKLTLSLSVCVARSVKREATAPLVSRGTRLRVKLSLSLSVRDA